MRVGYSEGEVRVRVWLEEGEDEVRSEVKRKEMLRG